MSTIKKLDDITPRQTASMGVQALANRPNESGQYGVGGLSPTQLKLWFDKLATFLAEKINEIHNTISSEEAANYIRIALDDYGVETLGDLVESMLSGAFAEKLLQVFPSADSLTTVSLQKYINDSARATSNIVEAFSVFDKKTEEISQRIDRIFSEHMSLVQEVDLSKMYAHAAFHAEEADIARGYTRGGKIDRRFLDIEKRLPEGSHKLKPEDIGAAPAHTWGTDNIDSGSPSTEPNGTLHLVVE